MKKIKIMKNGPYKVTGSIPLNELTVLANADKYSYNEGEVFPVEETYFLCRCGHSKNPPFCDGSHIKAGFNGNCCQEEEHETTIYENEKITLLDTKKLCSSARFCITNNSDIWKLIEDGNSDVVKKLAHDCPSGRLVVKEHNEVIEPVLEQEISILQDNEKGCSGPIFVKGGIPIIDEENNELTVRNRVTLCRCGASKNKPFCDASHIQERYNDKKTSN